MYVNNTIRIIVAWRCARSNCVITAARGQGEQGRGELIKNGELDCYPFPIYTPRNRLARGVCSNPSLRWEDR